MAAIEPKPEHNEIVAKALTHYRDKCLKNSDYYKKIGEGKVAEMYMEEYDEAHEIETMVRLGKWELKTHGRGRTRSRIIN